MAFDEVLRNATMIAIACAEGIEQQLGDGALLTVGRAVDSVAEYFESDQLRAASVRFTAGETSAGQIAFLTTAPFARELRNRAPDEMLATACGEGLRAAVREFGRVVGEQPRVEAVREVGAGALLDAGGEAAFVPVLDRTELVGFVAIVADAVITLEPETAPIPARSASEPSPLNAPLVLADVQLGVTAELGRCRMRVRDILAIQPGAVIDLDRPVNAPVDVLVNGKHVARGEVVVIDEEFAIRISEVL